jgi:dihydrofolate reductase
MKPEIKLFIATTIDGFIARENNSLDWLTELPNPNKHDYGYNEFISTIDTVIMGRRTYEEILGFDVDWPYPHYNTFVVTSNSSFKAKTKNTNILYNIDKLSIASLKSKSKKNIWIVGGGKIITAFLNHNAVDEMLLTIIPIILGKGIRLFPDAPKETNFKLIQAESFDTGLVNLTYKKK